MNDAEAPESNLSLEYIHGYRCDDTRNNIRYNKAGEVVYHAAAVGVVLCQEKNTQRHFFEHRSEIVSLAMHPNMLLCGYGGRRGFPADLRVGHEHDGVFSPDFWTAHEGDRANLLLLRRKLPRRLSC